MVEELGLEKRLAAISKLEQLSVQLTIAQYTKAYKDMWRGRYRKWSTQMKQLEQEVSFHHSRSLEHVDVAAIEIVCEPIEAAIQRLVDRIEHQRVAASYEEEERSDDDDEER